MSLDKDPHLASQPEFPLVSVCIPAYNSEVTLSETLDAVLAQDYPRLEVIVSDNQSTDRTRAIVERYAERGVRYCRHSEIRPAAMPSYRGVFANWDFVLAQGAGDYLCLFHSDDLYEPSMVGEQVEVMQAHPHVGAVFTRMQMIGEDSRPIRMGESMLPDVLRGRPTIDFSTLLDVLLAHFNFLPTPSVMLRRSVLDRVGRFDEGRFLTAADLEMWLRIARYGYEIAVIDQPLLKYRISRLQTGGEYHRIRTTLADVFGVLDHYLRQPGVEAMVLPQSIAVYELQRAADQVLCAMNLLAQERVAEARPLVRQAMRARHFITALRRPRLLAPLILGAHFWISICLGRGTLFGQLVYRAYQRNLQRRQQPLS